MATEVQRTALVSGASGGIGRAVVKRLAADGLRVYAGYCAHQDRAKAVAAECGAQLVQLDVCDAQCVNDACRGVFDAMGRLDIVVNCAAVNIEAPAAGMDDDAWNRVLETNLTGAFRLSRAAAKYMVLGRWGRIVHVSSIAAVHGGRGQINYAASKAGLEAMVRVLALELGRKGVLVNCVAPGIIETEMSARLRAEHGEQCLAKTALRRFGTPEEIADAVAFLVSEQAGYITGQVLRVDGGMAL